MRVYVPLLAVCCMLTSHALAQREPAVTLTHRLPKGLKSTYSLVLTVKQAADGRALNVECHQDYWQQVTAVSSSGDVTRVSNITATRLRVNGAEVPEGERETMPRCTWTIRPTGALAEVQFTGVDVNAALRSALVRRMISLQPILPDKPVKRNDRWTHVFPGNEASGQVSARAQCRFIGLEKHKNIDVARISVSYQETSGRKPYRCSGFFLIDPVTGDVTYADMVVTDLPPPSSKTPDRLMSGKLVLDRLAAEVAPVEVSASPAKPAKSISELTNGFEKQTGLFTLYRKVEAAKDTLYLELPETALGKPMMLQCTVNSGAGAGGLVAGSPVDDILFRLEKLDDERLVIVRPNWKFRADPDSPVARAVQRSVSDAWLDVLKIEARNAETQTLLVPIADLFRSDLSQITEKARAMGIGTWSIDKDKTAITSVRSFPANIVLATRYVLNRQGQPGQGSGIPPVYATTWTPLLDQRSIATTVTWNLYQLPENDYIPRLYDGRVGYFRADHMDYSVPKDDQVKRYIWRWHVQKSEPEAAVSDVKQPIVFWLDNAIPAEYRDVIREGLLWWNQAFERIGIRNVIRVEQMPDDADWDFADMRYNMVRWVVSPSSGYAVAQARVNPMTGQVLNAAITIDANMVRFTRGEFERFIDPFRAPGEDQHVESTHQDTCTLCHLGAESQRQAWFGWVAMQATDTGDMNKRTEQFIREYLRSIVAHEMGHILGLRHNFVASTSMPMDSLSDAAAVARHGITASVMDYTPYNLGALHHPDTDFWATKLGDYDLHAIEYGYRPSGATAPETEAPLLEAIASRCTRPGLQWLGDEYADGPDPYITRFDLAQEPLDYWQRMLQESRQILQKLPTKSVKPGESYYQFTRRFWGVIGMMNRALQEATRYVGGVRLHNNHKGDADEKVPLQAVSPQLQRRALRLIMDTALTDAFPWAPKAMYGMLAPNPMAGLADTTQRWDQPVRDRIAAIPIGLIDRLLAPDTLSAVANNSFRSAAPDSLSMAELMDHLHRAVLRQMNTRAYADTRILLQRAWVARMVQLALRQAPGSPEDACMLARHHLRLAQQQIRAASKLPHGAATTAHLDEMNDTITRALDYQRVVP